MSTQQMEESDQLLEEVLEILDLLPPELVLKYATPEQLQRIAILKPDLYLAALTPEQLMAAFTPEQLLAGISPEQRLTDLDRDHQALALPIELLRFLPDDYIRTLSPGVQAELHRRLDR
jgi:hypothetical protein